MPTSPLYRTKSLRNATEASAIQGSSSVFTVSVRDMSPAALACSAKAWGFVPPAARMGMCVFVHSLRFANAPQTCLSVGTSSSRARATSCVSASDVAMSTLFRSLSDNELRAAAASRRTQTSSFLAANPRASRAPATMICLLAFGDEDSPRSVETAALTSAASSEQAKEMMGGRPPSSTMVGLRASSTDKLHKA